MASNTYFIGGHFIGLINIRKFKEQENSNSAKQPELFKITERTVTEKLHSINPNINFSNLVEKMKDTRLTDSNKQDMFTSPDMLDSQYTDPVYNSDGIKLKTLDEKMKRDLSQIKPTITNIPPPSCTPSGNIVSSQTLLIIMSFYHPYDWLQRQGTNKGVKPHWKDLIQFHDGQTLADVRRAFVCQNMNKEIGGHLGQNPHKSLEYLGNNDLIHDFFYINNNIYVNSQPDKITKDHSVIMKKWAQNKGYTFGKVLSQETQLLDLEVCFGEPYIFQHLRQCEHLIVFNDIRFAQPHSSLDCYPKIIDIQKKN